MKIILRLMLENNSDELKVRRFKMSELINGREVLLALANGEEVQSRVNNHSTWHTRVKFWAVNDILSYNGEFRLKPRTITLNGLEVPAPFEPKHNQKYFYIYTENMSGYANDHYEENLITRMRTQFGAWRTEDEIKQVVAALRKVFKGEQNG